MKLFFFPAAPNPTRVLLYLAFKEAGGAEIPLDRVPIDTRKIVAVEVGQRRGAP